MIYPQNFEQKIGFDSIRHLLKGKCLSTLGEERVDEMAFSEKYEEINERLEQVMEFIRIIQEENEFPDQYFFDVRPSLKRIRIEGMYLDEQELFDLRRSLETIRDIVRFLTRTTEDEEMEESTSPYPALKRLAGDIIVFPQLITRINNILDKFGKIKDNASSELLRIRRELTSTTGSISRSLNAILRNAQSEGYVDKDVTPTMRDGRLVIPVAPGLKRKIKGIVHDESSTGKTVFIEPAEVVEANNRIRELEGEERREIIRILTDFSITVRPQVPAILQSYEFLAEIDFIRAKAQFAIQTNAIKPSLENKQVLDWRTAIHPLLQLSLAKHNKKVVPLDIELNYKQRILIISGPNAGGKSVCLKTVGLLQYMVQCGMPVPMHERSHIGIFSNIFIDIGDEQSIENDLSTYSSHLINMKNFLRYGDENTLILIDEFGTGTEPMLGGAIAEAILKTLNQKQVKGVITTHYQNLKHFAEDTEGIVNGAMLYDRHLMQPLFKLSIGNPGSSFAFEIAKKIGLPKEILEDAASKIGEDHINYDKHLKDIARDKRYWEEKRRRIHENEKRLDEVVEKYRQELTEASRLRKEIIKEAQQKAQEIIHSANKTIEQTIRDIRENQAEKEKTKEIRQKMEAEKERLLSEQASAEEERIRKKMEKLQNREKNKKTKNKASASTPASEGTTTELPLQKGDFVSLPNKAIGEILEINDKTAVIALGNLRTTAKLSQLKRASASQAKKVARTQPQASYANIRENISQKRFDFKPDIDLRGMRGEEALQKVITFLDEAVMLNYKEVRLLHGTGTGALRQLIRQYLSTNPLVASFGDEQIQLGGAGITVVKLDI